MKFKRNCRVLLSSSRENVKDKVWMRGTHDDNLDFYRGLNLLFSETLFFQRYIDDAWITCLQRTYGHREEVNINEK